MQNFALEWQNTDWSQRPHMSPQHNKNITTSHFDISFTHSSHLHTAQLMCFMHKYQCWIDVYSYFLYQMNKLGGVYVGKEPCINSN